MVRLFVVIIIVLAASFVSCKKEKLPYIPPQAYYQGSLHIFYLYAIIQQVPPNALSFYGTNGESDVFSMLIQPPGNSTAYTTGSYIFSPGTPGYLTIITSANISYTSTITGSWAQVNVTEFDSVAPFLVKGNFSGSLVNQANASDSIKVTQGSFCMTYI